MARFVSLTMSDRGRQRTIHLNLDLVRALRPESSGKTAVIFDEIHGFIVEDDIGLILKTLAES
jgi:hypothetical protein